MIIATFEIYEDSDSVLDTYTKEFDSTEDMREYARYQNQHPFLSLRIKEYHDEAEEGIKVWLDESENVPVINLGRWHHFKLRFFHLIGRCNGWCPICYYKACKWYEEEKNVGDWRGQMNTKIVACPHGVVMGWCHICGNVNHDKSGMTFSFNDVDYSKVLTSFSPTKLHASILQEAAGILQAVADSGVKLPDTWRWPIIDELNGMAAMYSEHPSKRGEKSIAPYREQGIVEELKHHAKATVGEDAYIRIYPEDARKILAEIKPGG